MASRNDQYENEPQKQARQREKGRKENKFSVFRAAGLIQKRRYNMYRQMVNTSGGKNVPLSFKQWKAAGMPTE